MVAQIWCFLCFLLAVMQTTSGSLSMDINPTNISLGLTKSLTINCTFSLIGVSDISGLISLVIAKESQQQQQQQQKFVDLVSLSIFTPDQMTGAAQINGTVSGYITGNGQSYLSIGWSFPTTAEAGRYRCEVNGVNNIGQPTEKSQTMTVTSQTPSLERLTDVVSDLQRQLDRQEVLLQNQSHTIDKLLSLVDAQSAIISSQSDTISQQSDNISNYTNKFTDMQKQLDLQNSLIKDMVFFTSLEYQRHYYMVSKHDLDNATEAEQTCQDNGGYLVEIDDYKEHEFIKQFLNTLPGFDYVLISGTDDGHNGTWTYTHSGGHLTYTAWASGEPDTVNSFCVEMHRRHSWQWYDYPCTNPRNSYRFLCEVNIIN